MVTKVLSCAFEGIGAYTVEVEIDARKDNSGDI